MLKSPLKIKVAYLYPDFLQGFCDKANLDVFKIRAQERNIEVEIEEIKNNDKIISAKYDFYYISGNNVEALEVCNKHLKNNYTELKIEAESKIPMLAINCGYILFGNTFQLNNSPLYQSAGILNVESKMMQTPVSTKIAGVCSFFKEKIVGYSNHVVETKLNENVVPFLTISKDKTEGAMQDNVLGTYITSPILAQNPHLCDFLISKCLQTKYKCNISLTQLTDDIEWYSHNYLVEAK